MMAGGDRHCWTIDDLRAGLDAVGSDPDPSTVFRALGRLESEGVVSRVAIDERRTYYELAGEHHEHLVCNGCGDVEAVPCGLLTSWVEQVRIQCGFEVADHEVVLRGRCRHCQPAGPPGPVPAPVRRRPPR